MDKISLVLILLFLGIIKITAQEKKETSIDKSLKISSQLFMSYQYQQDEDNIESNQFTLKRGYITFKRNINNKLSARFTQDITLDKEGSDAGNVEMRLKYCYLNARLPNFLFLEKISLEAGLVHRPWLPFEQKVNVFRVQGKMFLDKYDVIGSADFGVTLFANIGGELENQNYKYVNPGKFGSIALGAYNGGGYHAIEQNKNKTLEGRLSFRPFPSVLPGLQTNYTFAYGSGNVEPELPYVLSQLYLSFESKYAILGFQKMLSEGNAEGSYYDTDLKKTYFNRGYSLFADLRIPDKSWGLYSRYDNFQCLDEIHDIHKAIIVGLNYRFQKNMILFDLENQNNGAQNLWLYEIALELKF